MTRPKTVLAHATLALAGLALALTAFAVVAPAAARASGGSGGGASPGGAGNDQGAGSGGGSTGAPGGGSPGSPSGALSATSTAWLGGIVRIQGNLGPGAAHQPILIERQASGGGRWIMTVRTTADDHGAFTATWRAGQAGRLTLRAEVQSSQAGTAQASDPALTTALTVYRPAVATWYGPGSTGRRTACGERMTRQLLGVASRTLPCGTQVAISYRGRTVTVPVVDRGPYSSATWDLTWATAIQLGFTGRQRIGTAIVGKGSAPPGSPPPSSSPAGPGGPGPNSAAGGAVAGG